MKTYYVVTKGCYSDYHIVGVTDDKERAEHLKKFFTTDDEPAEVEEYIDEASEYDAEDDPWLVYIKRSLDSSVPANERDEEHVGRCSKSRWKVDDAEGKVSFDVEYGGDYPGATMWMYVFTKDKDLALKIARDEFAKRFAQEVGV